MAAYQVQAVHSEEVPPVTDTSPRAAGKGSNPFRLSHGDAERILASRGLDQPSDRFPRTSTQATPDQMLSVIHRRAVLGYSPKDVRIRSPLLTRTDLRSCSSTLPSLPRVAMTAISLVFGRWQTVRIGFYPHTYTADSGKVSRG